MTDRPTSSVKYGPWLVALGAALWGTESAWRIPLNKLFDAEVIVFWEHVLILLIFLPLLLMQLREIARIDTRTWGFLIFSAFAGSAVGTIFFTLALKHGNPTVVNVILNIQPVISTVGADASGQPYNVNADEAARAIAVAMQAEKIVYLTAVPGLLADPKDESSLIPRLTSAELRERLAHESVGKGMIPKLKACADAVDQGVGFAHIIDGRVHHSLLIELLTVHGVGTMVKKEASW